MQTKIFIDTEFVEGTQSKSFLGFKYGETKPTIDLISLGLISEDDRQYYAISKDFNFKEAWYRYDLKDGNKVYWLRDNVLMPIHYELTNNDHDLTYEEWKLIITKRENGEYGDRHYNTLKALIKAHGKTNKEIAEEVIEFCKDFGTIYNKDKDAKYNYLELTEDIQNLIDNEGYVIIKELTKPVFYAYYADYDWVVFCWLFGLMKDLPSNFPYYCRDLKQIADEIYESTGIRTRFESPKGAHNALVDAIWNKDFYDFLKSIPSVKWISVKDRLPNKPGKYVIKTIGTNLHKNTRKLESRFNGKTFDINNQVCIEWLDETITHEK